jgi:predicted TIM-barrel fold metal-dependent hydrolase
LGQPGFIYPGRLYGLSTKKSSYTAPKVQPEYVMIIDAHAHVFPHQNSAAGYPDVGSHLMAQQSEVPKFWGRMVTNTLDERCMPVAGEDVGFRVGKYGRYHWTKAHRECWLQRFPDIMVEMEWTPEQMIAFMDLMGVDVAVLQAGYMHRDYGRTYFANSMRSYPGRLVGTLSIDYDITQSEEYRRAELEKLNEAVETVGMRGVYQGFPREQPIDDQQFDPLWEEMVRLQIPHIFFVGFQPRQEYLDLLLRIERVLKKFPGLPGIIGHLGGNIRPEGHPDYTETPRDLLAILRLPNAYFEVGYVLAYENWELWGDHYEYPYPLHTEVVSQVYDAVGAERLLWGSDMPNVYRTCTYRQSLDLVRLHFDFLNDDEKELVLGKNAARVFRL